MTSLRRTWVAWVCLWLMPLVPAHAHGIETRAVTFAKGHAVATIKGSIKGDQTIDYTVHARAGQALSVKLVTTQEAYYFNVLAPGSND